MNGGFEKPFQRTGSTIKLGFVCSGGGGVEKEEKRRQRKRSGPRGALRRVDTHHLPAAGLGLGIVGPVLLLRGPGVQRRPEAVTNRVRARARCCGEQKVMEVEACGGRRPRLPSSHRLWLEGAPARRFSRLFAGA